MIQSGACWRMGNGESVLVGKDRRIPGNTRFTIKGGITGVGSMDGGSKVGELINGDLGVWKRDLVYSMFEEENAMNIINNPLSARSSADKLIWHK